MLKDQFLSKNFFLTKIVLKSAQKLEDFKYLNFHAKNLHFDSKIGVQKLKFWVEKLDFEHYKIPNFWPIYAGKFKYFKIF